MTMPFKFKDFKQRAAHNLLYKLQSTCLCKTLEDRNVGMLTTLNHNKRQINLFTSSSQIDGVIRCLKYWYSLRLFLQFNCCHWRRWGEWNKTAFAHFCVCYSG